MTLGYFKTIYLTKKILPANFAIPTEEPSEEGETPLYSELIFAELDREEATKVVEEYRKVGHTCS